MSKITLNNVGSLIDATTAATTINNNFATIQTAMDNTLSRDGTSPNQMADNLDMNSMQIINLPKPATANSPLRLQELEDFTGSGTISLLPSGGLAGQGLTKHSNTNYDVQWSNVVTNVGLSLPADFAVTGSPVTGAGTLTGNWAAPPTGTGAMVRAVSPGLTTPNIGVAQATSVNRVAFTAPATGSTLTIADGKTLTASNSLTLAGTDGTTQTFQASDTIVGRATTDTLTNKTIDTAGPNTIKLNGNTLTAGAGVGTLTAPSGTHTLAVLDANTFTAAQTVTSNTNPQLVVQTASGDNATVQANGATNTIQMGETASSTFLKTVSNTAQEYWTNNTKKMTLAADGGLFSVNATGGSKGSDTINFGALYQQGQLLGQPSFQAIRTTTQTLTASTPARVNFDTKIFDTGGYYDNTTNFRFTPLIVGKYLIICNVQISATWTSGQFMNIWVSKNGSGTTVNGGFSSIYPPTGAGSMIQGNSTIVTLNGSTDFIEIWANTSGVTPSIVGSAAPCSTSFMAHYIGP